MTSVNNESGVCLKPGRDLFDVPAFAWKYGIPFLDYSTDSFSFRKELFYNIQHLNKKGAELFTWSLAKKLNGLDFKSKYEVLLSTKVSHQ